MDYNKKKMYVMRLKLYGIIFGLRKLSKVCWTVNKRFLLIEKMLIVITFRHEKNPKIQ